MVPPLCMTLLSGLKLLLLTVTAADAGGVVALAVNVTAVGRPVNVAVTVCGEVDPRLSVVVATPLALVVLWAGETAPSPDATAQLTTTPGTGQPLASRAVTLKAVGSGLLKYHVAGIAGCLHELRRRARHAGSHPATTAAAAAGQPE